MSVALVKAVNDVFGGDIDYQAYNFTNTTVAYGLPPIPLSGLEYIAASHSTTQNRMIMSLTGEGVFCGNRNNSGVIQVGLMDSCASVAAIQLMAQTGLAFPIFAADSSTVGSFVLALKCKPIKSPSWKRSLVPGITTFTFMTPRLTIVHGVRKSDN